MRTLVLAVTFYTVMTGASWAYLNPGTSSLILQGVAASFAVIAGFLALGWRQVKDFVRKLFRRPVQEQESPQTDESGKS